MLYYNFNFINKWNLFCDTSFRRTTDICFNSKENSCVALFATKATTYKYNKIKYFNQIVLFFTSTHIQTWNDISSY